MAKPFFPTAPPPVSGLARYRLLCPRAAIHVSPIQLGAMNIGDKWHEYGMGSMDKESSMKLLDAYYDNGGNFIDTANAYQDGTSESFIGEWMEKRGNRARMIIATKYTTNFKLHDDDIRHTIQFQGNNSKSLRNSIEQSLKNLRTDYIDIFYVHWWDFTTSVEELMNSLHHLVQSGKVLYLGISDTPAWVVCLCNQYARDHGMTQFSIYQGNWNILERSFERDILPMARHEGMALAPWNVLATGRFRTDEEDERRRKTGEHGRTTFEDWERSDDEKRISAALQEVANEIGAKHITAEALEITLTPEHIKRLESVVPFAPGFPNNMIGDGSAYAHFYTSVAYVEDKPRLEALRPSHQR